MKFLAVVTPPSIYYGFSNWNNLCKDKLTPVKTKICACRNVRKHKEIKNGEQYIALDMYLQNFFLEKR